MRENVEENQPLKLANASLKTNEDTCPQCGSTQLVRAGRCDTCYFCGWSKCNL